MIAATLDRLAGRGRRRRVGAAPSRRGSRRTAFFEFGPEQRLRGLAPTCSSAVEGLSGTATAATPGSSQLVKRQGARQPSSPRPAPRSTPRSPTPRQRVGSGPRLDLRRRLEHRDHRLSRRARGGADPRGADGEHGRRHSAVPAAAARSASRSRSSRPRVTWVVAQTVLGSLARLRREARGGRLAGRDRRAAADPQLVLPPRLLDEHLAGLHGRKKRLLAAAASALSRRSRSVSPRSASRASTARGSRPSSSCRRSTLEAGMLAVLPGVAARARGDARRRRARRSLLERKLPHKKMLIATGVLIPWVLVVIVGTDRADAPGGRLAARDADRGPAPPYWAGLWLGVYPTWEGARGPGRGASFVVGSYLAAEHVRARRRRRVLASVATTR